MQIFKKHTALIVSALLSAAHAQTSIGSVTSPSMPVISSPEIGSGFYAPGSILEKNFSGEKDSKNSSEEKKSAENEAAQKKEIQTEKARQLAAALTANDMSLLKNRGLSGDINSLIFSLSSSEGSYETNALLNKILAEIEKLKEDSKPSDTAAEKQIAAKTSEPEGIKKPARILRFSVNGYNILSTCRAIYISDVQLDGTFLVTGDRIYSSDGKKRTETFHILFKSCPGDDGISNYTAAVKVTQDFLNENSFLYQMSKSGEIQAMRVGNFVSVRTEDPGWKLELLIDLGEKQT
ncbi:hypothetical protein [Treponema sp.]|uniref:hypothetical protein n=1 Tax=Treponema sp. TaxID=166 RepID=UPI003F0E2D1D